MVTPTGMATTLVSPTIQVLAPHGLRMVPADATGTAAQPLALTVHAPPTHVPTTSKYYPVAFWAIFP